MKKTMSLILTLLILCAVLSGCVGIESGMPEDTAADTSAVTHPEAETAFQAETKPEEQTVPVEQTEIQSVPESEEPTDPEPEEPTDPDPGIPEEEHDSQSVTLPEIAIPTKPDADYQLPPGEKPGTQVVTK